MKKISVSLLLVIMLIILTGCSTNKSVTIGANVTQNMVLNETQEQEVNNVNIEDELIKVLNNENKFTTQEGNSIYLKDYDTYLNMNEIKKYAFVDFDQDGENELLAYTKAYAGEQFVFHYEKENIYGYVMPDERRIADVKTDGTYTSSTTAYTIAYKKMIFDGNVLKEENIAIKDYEKYEIDSKDVSKTEFEVFVKNQKEKEGITWKEFISNNSNINLDNLDFNSNNEIVYICKEGDANYSEYTEDILTLRKDGSAEIVYTYPGVTMFGTYIYEDDKFVVTYTEQIEEINGNERMPINIVYTYEIKNGKLYFEESPYYTAIYERSK